MGQSQHSKSDSKNIFEIDGFFNPSIFLSYYVQIYFIIYMYALEFGVNQICVKNKKENKNGIRHVFGKNATV